MSIVERALKKAQDRDPGNPRQRREQPQTPESGSPDSLPPVVHRQLKLDRERLRETGALPPLEHERQLTEQYRRIKRPLVAYALNSETKGVGNPQIIMVASAVPGEGKTFTAINLAISLAQERDVNVLLVDSDIAKPHVSDLCSLRGERGLFDALADESLDVESLVFDTGVAGLSFLPAGIVRDGSAELLASHRMHALMNQLLARDARRLVVIDSPPLLLTNESRELVNMAGQVVLVVRAGSTEQQAVLDAIALIPEGKNTGLILNYVNPKSSDVQFYGYGQYGTSSAPATQA